MREKSKSYGINCRSLYYKQLRLASIRLLGAFNVIDNNDVHYHRYCNKCSIEFCLSCLKYFETFATVFAKFQ